MNENMPYVTIDDINSSFVEIDFRKNHRLLEILIEWFSFWPRSFGDLYSVIRIQNKN